MIRPVATEDVARFLDLAASGEQHHAVRLMLNRLDEGVPANALIADLLAAAQRQVGERWYRGEWTTADEHLASGAAQAALEALATTTPPPEPKPHGMALVACAEGDWHSLPAQMFAEALRIQGYGVWFLGASTPVDDVAAFIARRRPDVLAVSCNVALFYTGTARLIDAAHRHRVPVIAGGRALTPSRATALGADAWAPDAVQAAQILRGWHRRPPHVDSSPMRLDDTALTLEARAPALAEAAFDTLTARLPYMAGYDTRQLARTRVDLVYIVRFIAAARLTGDRTVFTTFERWLAELLAYRGVPASALPAGLTALAPLLGEIDDAASRLALSGVASEC